MMAMVEKQLLFKYLLVDVVIDLNKLHMWEYKYSVNKKNIIKHRSCKCLAHLFVWLKQWPFGSWKLKLEVSFEVRCDV